jgi:hypothetical protein
MTMRKTLTTVLVAGVALAAATGCGSKTEENPNAGDTSSASAAAKPTKTVTPTPTLPPAKTADPPLKFDKAAGVNLPGTLRQGNLAGHVTTSFTTLHQRTAYVVSAYDLTAIDVISGKQQWKTPIEGVPADPNAQAGPFVNDAGPRPPVVSEDGKTVIGAFPITVPGKGTTPAHFAVAVMAVGAEKGDVQWSALVDAPTSEVSDGQGAITRVVGITDQAVVFTYVVDGFNETFAIDPATQKTLWRQPKYAGGTVQGDVVTGIDTPTYGDDFESQVTGRGLSDGKQRWVAAKEAGELKLVGAGAETLVMSYTDYKKDVDVLLFVDPATGKPKRPAETAEASTLGSNPFDDCTYDQQSIVVCVVGTDMQQLRAFDAASGKQLWAVPKDKNENREVPSVRAVWHGAIYGTTSNGPIVLDGTTGADKSTEVGVAPHWVSEYAGITGGDSDGPVAYPVAG